MDRNILSPGIFGAILFSVSAIFYYLIENWRQSRQEKVLGCRRPHRQHNKLPFGIDYLWTVLKADREHRVPQELLKICRDTKHATFVHQCAGNDSIVTSDPKNVQAILALQFKDFSLGSRRSQNFYPMLGNGIFTTDGEMW